MDKENCHCVQHNVKMQVISILTETASFDSFLAENVNTFYTIVKSMLILPSDTWLFFNWATFLELPVLQVSQLLGIVVGDLLTSPNQRCENTEVAGSRCYLSTQHKPTSLTTEHTCVSYYIFTTYSYRKDDVSQQS